MELLNAKVPEDAEIFKLGWLEDLSHLIRMDGCYEKLIESRDPIKLKNDWHIEYFGSTPEDNKAWGLSFVLKGKIRCYKYFEGKKSIADVNRVNGIGKNCTRKRKICPYRADTAVEMAARHLKRITTIRTNVRIVVGI